MLLQLASSSYAPPSRASVRMQQGMADMNQPELKSPLPWMERPTYLDGTLAGDVGFDPLSFTTKYSEGVKFSLLLNEFDSKDTEFIFGPNTQDAKRSLTWMREAEVKHARLAMLAAAGWPLAELWHGGLSRLLGLPYALEATQGRSPSLLNGHLFDAAPFLVLATLGMIAVELKTLDQVYGLTSTGKTINANGDLVMKSYVPGDLGFDPLGLYDINSMQVPPMIELRMKADPQVRIDWVNFNRKQMEAQEIYHGRAAMIGITGFAVQEFITGQPIVDQTSLFFTPFWEILAPGLASSLAQDLGF